MSGKPVYITYPPKYLKDLRERRERERRDARIALAINIVIALIGIAAFALIVCFGRDEDDEKPVEKTQAYLQGYYGEGL